MNKVKPLFYGALLLAGAITADFYYKYKNNQPFETVEGKHYINVVQTDMLNKAKEKLNINENQSFEIMSYTCPACMTMNKTFKYLSSKYNFDYTSLQLGGNENDSSILAEAEFIVKKVSPSNLDDFKEKMFSMMTSSNNYETKISFAKTIPLEYGVTMEQLGDFEVAAKEYSKNTALLADSLKIESTPAFFLYGKYYIVHYAHKNTQELEETIKYLSNLEK